MPLTARRLESLAREEPPHTDERAHSGAEAVYRVEPADVACGDGDAARVARASSGSDAPISPVGQSSVMNRIAPVSSVLSASAANRP